MADLVLIPLPGLGVLKLARAQYEAALVPLPTATGERSPDEDLLEAKAAAAKLGVTARWLEDSARAGIVPHYKLGRFLRFRVSEVTKICKVNPT
jgi:hypothetical protein